MEDAFRSACHSGSHQQRPNCTVEELTQRQKQDPGWVEGGNIWGHGSTWQRLHSDQQGIWRTEESTEMKSNVFLSEESLREWTVQMQNRMIAWVRLEWTLTQTPQRVKWWAWSETDHMHWDRLQHWWDPLHSQGQNNGWMSQQPSGLTTCPDQPLFTTWKQNLQPPVKMFQNQCYLFLKLVKLKWPVGAKRIKGEMSRNETLSIRARSTLDFSKWGQILMPRGGILDRDSSKC